MVEKKRDFCMCTFWNADCCELCSEGYAGLAGEVPAGTPPGGRAALVFVCVPIWRGVLSRVPCASSHPWPPAAL